jgi:hypothetical protein
MPSTEPVPEAPVAVTLAIVTSRSAPGVETSCPPHEERGADVLHADVRHAHVLERAPVHRLQRDSRAQLALHEVTTALEHAVTEEDVPEIAARLRAELERVVLGHEPAPLDRHPLGGARGAEGEARLEHDGVIARLHRAVGDVHVAAAIGVDPVGVAVLDAHRVDVHIVAAEEADRVVPGVGHGDPVDPDPAALAERDRLRAFPRAAIAVDAAGPHDGDILEPPSLQEREREVARFPVGEGLVGVLFRGVEVLVVAARHEDRVPLQSKRDPAAQTQRPGPIRAGGNDHGAPDSGQVIDRGLDGARVHGAAVTPRAELAHAERRRRPRGARGQDEQRRGEGSGAGQEGPPRFGHHAHGGARAVPRSR